jgi:hypothetical protein
MNKGTKVKSNGITFYDCEFPPVTAITNAVIGALPT